MKWVANYELNDEFINCLLYVWPSILKYEGDSVANYLINMGNLWLIRLDKFILWTFQLCILSLLKLLVNSCTFNVSRFLLSLKSGL